MCDPGYLWFSQDKKSAVEWTDLLNVLVTLRSKGGKILLNGVCIQPSLTTELLIRSQQNRFWYAWEMWIFVFLDENWNDFHEVVVDIFKEKFQSEGIVGSKFKPYSYVFRIGERK